jgi:predicted regulator of amino acid metabolism with ACT domain
VGKNPGLREDKVADLLAMPGVTMRQAQVEDPVPDPDPMLVLIGWKQIPGSFVQEPLNIPGLARVSVSGL